MKSVLRLVTVAALLLAAAVTGVAGPGSTRPAAAAPAPPTGHNTLIAWGENGGGEFGGSTYEKHPTPTSISGLPDLQDVSVGSGYSLGLDTTGHVWAWGYGGRGGLGPASQADQSPPVAVPGLNDVVGIATTTNSGSAAVNAAGDVFTWGCKANPNWEPYTCDVDPTPTKVDGLPPVKSVAGGDSHWLAVTWTGDVWSWGRDEYGRLGRQPYAGDVYSAPARVDGISDVVAVDAGSWHSVALTADGHVYSWGWDQQGQLGIGPHPTNDFTSQPTLVPDLDDVRSISTRWQHTVALRGDGSLYGWGYGLSGALGVTQGRMAAPLRMPFTNVATMDAGAMFTVVALEDGSVWAFGTNGFGELGSGSITTNYGEYNFPNPGPVRVVGVHDVTKISAGYSSVLALGSIDPIPAGRPPSKPTKLYTDPGNGSITVSWDPPADDGGLPITGYTVSPGGNQPDGNGGYISNEPVFVGPDTRSVTLYYPNGTALDKVGVTASNAAGTSADDAEIADGPGRPDEVSNVQVQSGIEQATISWPEPDTNGAPITSYQLYERLSDPAYSALLLKEVDGSTRSVTLGADDVCGQNRNQYHYFVVATNKWGRSYGFSLSDPAAVTCRPSAPPQVTATSTHDGIDLAWSPAPDGGSPIQHYEISGGPSPITVGPDVHSTSATGLTSGQKYQFEVRAVNAVGAGASSGASAVAGPEAHTPGAPTGVTAVAGDASATVSWQRPADPDGLSPARSYQVLNQWGNVMAQVGDVTSVRLDGLPNGSSCYFYVLPSNAAGQGTRSDASNQVIPEAPPTLPGAPAALQASAGDGSATVSWAPPDSDGHASIDHYTVTVNPGGRQLTVSGTSTQLTGLTNGTTYSIAVTAHNSVGNGPSASGSVTPVRVFLPPGQPTELSVTPGDGTAAVSWSPPTVNGGAANVDYYIVTVNPGGQQVAATGTSTQLTGLANGTTYSVSVTASNAAATSWPATASVMPVAFGRFHAVTPHNGYSSGSTPLSSTAPRDVTITGIPANATAVVVNAQVVNPTATGYLRLGPAGTTPGTSNVFFTKAQRTANLAVVPVVNGKARLALSAGTTTVYLDVFGYYRS